MSSLSTVEEARMKKRFERLYATINFALITMSVLSTSSPENGIRINGMSITAFVLSVITVGVEIYYDKKLGYGKWDKDRSKVKKPIWVMVVLSPIYVSVCSFAPYTQVGILVRDSAIIIGVTSILLNRERKSQNILRKLFCKK